MNVETDILDFRERKSLELQKRRVPIKSRVIRLAMFSLLILASNAYVQNCFAVCGSEGVEGGGSAGCQATCSAIDRRQIDAAEAAVRAAQAADNAAKEALDLATQALEEAVRVGHVPNIQDARRAYVVAEAAKISAASGLHRAVFALQSLLARLGSRCGGSALTSVVPRAMISICRRLAFCLPTGVAVEVLCSEGAMGDDDLGCDDERDRWVRRMTDLDAFNASLWQRRGNPPQCLGCTASERDAFDAEVARSAELQARADSAFVGYQGCLGDPGTALVDPNRACEPIAQEGSSEPPSRADDIIEMDDIL